MGSIGGIELQNRVTTGPFWSKRYRQAKMLVKRHSQGANLLKLQTRPRRTVGKTFNINNLSSTKGSKVTPGSVILQQESSLWTKERAMAPGAKLTPKTDSLNVNGATLVHEFPRASVSALQINLV